MRDRAGAPRGPILPDSPNAAQAWIMRTAHQLSEKPTSARSILEDDFDPRILTILVVANTRVTAVGRDGIRREETKRGAAGAPHLPGPRFRTRGRRRGRPRRSVGKTGVEPALSRFRRARPLHLVHFPKSFNSPGGWSRTSTSAFSARCYYRVSFTEKQQLRVKKEKFKVENQSPCGFQLFTLNCSLFTDVPRQGIEPCISRLKAGGFAVEACEAST